jgi:hypothetical protein
MVNVKFKRPFISPSESMYPFPRQIFLSDKFENGNLLSEAVSELIDGDCEHPEIKVNRTNMESCLIRGNLFN